MGIAINLFYFALFEGYFFSREGEVNDSDGSVWEGARYEARF